MRVIKVEMILNRGLFAPHEISTAGMDMKAHSGVGSLLPQKGFGYSRGVNLDCCFEGNLSASAEG